MCQFASFVLTKDREFWLETSDSHEEIISRHKLHADGVTGPNIIRVELTPPMDGLWSDLSHWDFRIDQDITPGWAPRCDVDAMQAIQARTIHAASCRFRDEYSAGGHLSLDGCTGLKALPENLKVGDSLSLEGCTGLKALPENLKVGGSLYLNGCTGLKALPENLKVGGYLSLEGCTATVPASLRGRVIR